MDDIIISVTAGLIIAAVSSIAGMLWQQLKHVRQSVESEKQRLAEHAELMADLERRLKHDKLVDDALRALLFCRLEKINSQQVDAGHVCPTHVKEQAEQIYAAYHALGGNGLGTQMIEDIRDAHIKPDPQ